MHPFQKHREHKASHARVKTILKAGGGPIDEDVDVRSKDEVKSGTTVPYGLGQLMQYEKTSNDSKEVASGKRFSDTGTRVPGAQKARNDAYTDRLKKR